VFRLDLRDGEVRELYLRIRHERGADFPVRLETEGRHDQQLQLEYAGLGGTFGAMLLLIAACLAWSWAFHDRAFAWYAVYVLLASLSVASFTGAAAHLLWPGFDALRDAPTSMLSCGSVAAALLFVRSTLGLRRRMPLQDSIVLALAATGAVLTVLPAFAAKAVYLPLVGGYITLASASVMMLAGAAWWRGDVVGRWVFAAHAPMVVAAVTAAFRVVGWAHIPFSAQNLVVAALAIEVPLLLVALFIRSRDRHSAEIREQALSTHDALTGLLAAHLFHDRLRQVIARHRRGGEGAAVMYIELVNHGRIRDYFGGAVADQSLLRSVIKLRRLLGDVDTVSRLGDARFGVILEGATQRSSVTERASRLIAGGLMPLPGLKPEVTLQFHVAALLLHELPLEPEQVDAALAEQLARMSPRTRRPIRFLSPGRSASDSGDSSMFAPEADLQRPPPALQVVASRT
jgi:diguanylate cyclase (GGDEF)-like protein